jgi:hypothetical protein
MRPRFVRHGPALRSSMLHATTRIIATPTASGIPRAAAAISSVSTSGRKVVDDQPKPPA